MKNGKMMLVALTLVIMLYVLTACGDGSQVGDALVSEVQKESAMVVDMATSTVDNASAMQQHLEDGCYGTVSLAVEDCK